MRPTYVLSRWLFLRLLGIVYLVAFASLAVQVRGLIGEHGLFPLGEYLERARETYGERDGPRRAADSGRPAPDRAAGPVAFLPLACGRGPGLPLVPVGRAAAGS